ncbi:alpha/beta-hydrolase [Glonium stellatum]|uniref:Alpha/beta-hydrolase n=1 Tax=Glonium stellatum TaxID=574774 RepID=A0A8E2F6Z8_9PEZI|nr:alpha/beta-hydrolase [Glonium stellatum]
MLLCSIPWIQRQLLYLHNVSLWWGLHLNKPETVGFLKNQVAALRIHTGDGERLYAWLVAPLGVYARNASRFQEDHPAALGGLRQPSALRLLAEDPDARLIIYFHGNSATVAQPRRTEEYRMVSSGASDKIFVLAFDYRGFGYSTGTPSEQGCINDAISVIKWALEEVNIAPERILLLAQSLGTAVASAAAHYFINLEPPVEFVGMVLCAGFTDTSSVFQSYSIGGVVPLLAPVKAFPFLQAWLGRQMKDTWKTGERLADLVQKSNRIHLTLLHATSDNVIPFEQTAELFYRAVEASSELGLTRDEIDNKKSTIDLGEGGYIETWASGNKIIQKEIVKHGGHNSIMKWGPVSLAVAKSFGLPG